MKRRLAFIIFSIIIHLLLVLLVLPIWPYVSSVKKFDDDKNIRVNYIPEPQTLEEVIPEQVEIGQIVDLPDPKEEIKPDDADYLAEKQRKVTKETKTDKFRLNPEILSEEYSKKDQAQFEDALDLNMEEPSTGAKVGNDDFNPEENGILSSLPSPFMLTNKDGLDKPTLSSSTQENLSGAPNNDLLFESNGDRVSLNTHEYRFASYLNQIRRLVNFHWNQNLKNLNTPLSKPKYNTVVEVKLDSKGVLKGIEVSKESGVRKLDDCVSLAFEVASPFPEPPNALISSDGLVHLPTMGFEVNVGGGRAQYNGVDPRSSIRFPGILKANR